MQGWPNLLLLLEGGVTLLWFLRPSSPHVWRVVPRCRGRQSVYVLPETRRRDGKDEKHNSYVNNNLESLMV